MAALWSCERLLCMPTETLLTTWHRRSRRGDDVLNIWFISARFFWLQSRQKKSEKKRGEVLHSPTVPLWVWKLQSSFTARCSSANISCNPCQTRLWVVNKFPIVNSTMKMIPKDIFSQMLPNTQDMEHRSSSWKKKKVRLCELHENVPPRCEDLQFIFTVKELVAWMCEAWFV